MKKLIREITDLNFTLSGVNRAIITAVGNVPTTGWTNPELTDSGETDKGIRFDFVAEPPTGMAGNVISPLTVSKTVPLLGQGVVVRSETNEKTLQLPQQGDPP